MFFNSKRFESVSLTAQKRLEIGSSNTLSFYIKDLFSETVISSIDYLAIKVQGRTETIQGTYVNITDIAGDTYSFSYTPLLVTSDVIKFRLKITDASGDEHFIDTDDYTLISGA